MIEVERTSSLLNSLIRILLYLSNMSTLVSNVYMVTRAHVMWTSKKIAYNQFRNAS